MSGLNSSTSFTEDLIRQVTVENVKISFKSKRSAWKLLENDETIFKSTKCLLLLKMLKSTAFKGAFLFYSNRVRMTLKRSFCLFLSLQRARLSTCHILLFSLIHFSWQPALVEAFLSEVLSNIRLMFFLLLSSAWPLFHSQQRHTTYLC